MIQNGDICNGIDVVNRTTSAPISALRYDLDKDLLSNSTVLVSDKFSGEERQEREILIILKTLNLLYHSLYKYYDIIFSCKLAINK